jgi:hypothetical protein
LSVAKSLTLKTYLIYIKQLRSIRKNKFWIIKKGITLWIKLKYPNEKISFLFIVFFYYPVEQKLQSHCKRPLFEVLTQQSDGGVTFISTRFWLTNEIKMLQNDKQLKNRLLLWCSKIKFCYFEYGWKKTGGYSVAVESVQETEKNNHQCKESRWSQMVGNSRCYLSVLCCQVINSKKKLLLNKKMPLFLVAFFYINWIILELVFKTQSNIRTVIVFVVTISTRSEI